jgi:hypothetical protein
MTPEDRLSAFLNADRPPARDLAFEAVVMQRVFGRRLVATLMTVGALAAALGVVLWALAPLLTPLIESIGALLGPVAAALTLGAAALVFGRGLLSRI